jgi:hypothetical protein
MPKKIHILKEKESYDFGLIGISSPENDYRISWILNNAKGYRLVRQEDLEFPHKQLDDPQRFHQFRYFDEESLLLYRLISNKSENGYLIWDMPRADYLILVSGELEEGLVDALVKDLNGLEGISLAFRLEPDSLKSRRRLLL